ncbi:hypothetical protein B7L88_gp002 [Rhizobium phage RHEph10]|uniref:hypothetical protein n=1 Tax=Rhizobium phage RHEph10 TaxID=1220717 RepID=UPI0002AB086A|nr:hypothetical protein B7L88_gp002 [Rhizobium phage RHEph10]AGC36046.1 hypothetical protein RHEph10_gp002 [Rhizobium phage RHEph10]
MEHFTGNLGKVRFVDGVSADLTPAQAEVVGAAYKSVLVQANGTTVIGPASPAARAATQAPDRAAPAPAGVAPVEQARTDLEPFYIKTIDKATYTLSDDDAGYLLDFVQGTTITVPTGLADDFYCSLRQGGASQIRVVGAGVTVEEIDNQFRSEKRLAVLQVARFPDGKFQLLGRTAS